MTSYDAVHDRVSRLYEDPAALGISLSMRLDPVEILSPSDRFMPIEECGDELVGLDPSLFDLDVFHHFGFERQRPRVRTTLDRRLCEVDDLLPPPFHLVIIEGWRSRERQELLHGLASEAAGAEASSFAADPDAPGGIVPPHSTGGAVDVTLGCEGAPLALGCAVGTYDDRAHLAALEASGREPGRALRRLLYWTMRRAGFVGIREEWWHYSLYDQEWAAQTGAPAARYGSIEWNGGSCGG